MVKVFLAPKPMAGPYTYMFDLCDLLWIVATSFKVEAPEVEFKLLKCFLSRSQKNLHRVELTPPLSNLIVVLNKQFFKCQRTSELSCCRHFRDPVWWPTWYDGSNPSSSMVWIIGMILNITTRGVALNLIGLIQW